MISVEDRVAALEARNKKVEADKAWETSAERRLAILVLTYVVVAIFFYATDAPNPWLSAIVPSVGFFLSTLTLQLFKKGWLAKNKSEEIKES